MFLDARFLRIELEESAIRSARGLLETGVSSSRVPNR